MILFLLPPDPPATRWVWSISFWLVFSKAAIQQLQAQCYHPLWFLWRRSLLFFRELDSLTPMCSWLWLSPSQGCPCPSPATVTLRRACVATPRTNGGTLATGCGGGGPPRPPTPAQEETTPRDWVNTLPSPQIYRAV